MKIALPIIVMCFAATSFAYADEGLPSPTRFNGGYELKDGQPKQCEKDIEITNDKNQVIIGTKDGQDAQNQNVGPSDLWSLLWSGKTLTGAKISLDNQSQTIYSCHLMGCSGQSFVSGDALNLAEVSTENHVSSNESDDLSSTRVKTDVQLDKNKDGSLRLELSRKVSGDNSEHAICEYKKISSDSANASSNPQVSSHEVSGASKHNSGEASQPIPLEVLFAAFPSGEAD
jgi:hypothetical protein